MKNLRRKPITTAKIKAKSKSAIKSHFRTISLAIKYMQNRDKMIIAETLEMKKIAVQAPVSFLHAWIGIELKSGFFCLNDLANIIQNVYKLSPKQVVDTIYQVMYDKEMVYDSENFS